VINNASTVPAKASAPVVTQASTVAAHPAPAAAPAAAPVNDGGIVLPKTGPGEMVAGGLGIAGTIIAGSLYAGSRRDLLSALLNK